MKTAFFALIVLTMTFASASAQRTTEKVRFEWVSGIFLAGAIAEADFEADFTNFGGNLVQRTNGFLDVDPSISYGVRSSYRFSEKLSVWGTWVHSRGRLRVQFPAESQIAGNFDLEGLLLAGDDFATGGREGQRAEQAMSDATTDYYMAGAMLDFPIMERWMIPFLTVGFGRLSQSSDGNVIDFEYDGDLPPFAENIVNSGGSQVASLGLSVFSIDQSNWVASFGGGVRVGLSSRWGANITVEDIVRIGTDFTDLDDASTPPPDPDNFIIYSSTFRGNEGLIHSVGISFSLNYALWPFEGRR